MENKHNKAYTCFSRPHEQHSWNKNSQEQHFSPNPHENINPQTPKLYKSTNLRDEKRGLPLESDSLQLSSKLQSLKWSEMVRNGKFSEG